MKTEIATQGLKATPPATVVTVTWMNGLSLNEIVAFATLVYISLQIGYLIWKWVREYRKGG